VPHISLVFREMWDTTVLNLMLLGLKTSVQVLDGCPRFAPAYLGRKRRGDPDFLYAALDTTAYAAFIKESRMKFALQEIRGKPLRTLRCPFRPKANQNRQSPFAV
jgi:hypothetical protein